jgi:hypothetical protein
LFTLCLCACASERGAQPELDFADRAPDLGAVEVTRDPTTCAEAAALRSYVGCEYWPNTLSNHVDDDYDFAVVVANAGDMDAELTIDGPGGFHITETVTAGNLRTLKLPWVPGLHPSNTFDLADYAVSAKVPKGSYHLVSSVPVVAYQFNPLEYEKTYQGVIDYSYSNDASLLIPTSALGRFYRVTGYPSWHDGDGWYPSYFVVTATADATDVTVELPSKGAIAAGPGVAAVAGGETVHFTLDRGDALTLVTEKGDPSGALVVASAPVQVMAGTVCTYVPDGVAACDHLEESVFPAETLGSHYLVTVPTGPAGVPKAHVVRIYGNVDGTHLTYDPHPPGAPATIDAGEVADLHIVSDDFEVRGDHAFAVGSFQVGADLFSGGSPPADRMGDPSQSLAIAVEQFRSSYLFLAPTDYPSSFVDVVAPAGTAVFLDDVAISDPGTPIGGSGFVTRRARLGGGDGVHRMRADRPFGIEVIGYGSFTSYEYPGGLDLRSIAPQPVL